MLPIVVIHPFWILFPSCVILSALSIVEVGLVSSIVSYVHLQGLTVYEILSPEYNFPLDAIPAHLNLDAGHVSNAAAGLGFFLGLFGVFIALKDRRYLSREKDFGTSFVIFSTFVIFAVFESLLALAALIYSFVYFNQTAGFAISLARASKEIGQHYTENEWAPGTWFSAVMALPLESESARNDIRNHLQIMEISKWILILIFALTYVVLAASVFGLIQNRRRRFE